MALVSFKHARLQHRFRAIFDYFDSRGALSLRTESKRQGYTIWTFAWGRKDDGAPDELAIINRVPERLARSAGAPPH